MKVCSWNLSDPSGVDFECFHPLPRWLHLAAFSNKFCFQNSFRFTEEMRRQYREFSHPPYPVSTIISILYYYGGGGGLVAKSRLTLLWPSELQPARLLCPWDFQGKNTGVGFHFRLQGILGPHLALSSCQVFIPPQQQIPFVSFHFFFFPPLD